MSSSWSASTGNGSLSSSANLFSRISSEFFKINKKHLKTSKKIEEYRICFRSLAFLFRTPPPYSKYSAGKNRSLKSPETSRNGVLMYVSRTFLMKCLMRKDPNKIWLRLCKMIVFLIFFCLKLKEERFQG